MTLEIDLEKRRGVFRLAARFSAGPGITALFGRSGSGKSTLINLIAGLERPDRGRIVIGDTVMFDQTTGIDLPVHRRRLGYVFQEGRLFPHLSVRHNLSYGRRFTRPADRYVAFEQVVDLLGLEGVLDRRPGTLSGGEKQRVAIGRALLTSPRLLLMDEPLAALDQARKDEILPYIEHLRDEMRVPVIYVSHSIEEVTRLATTLVLLDHGTVMAAGPVEALTGRLDLHPLLGRYEAGTVISGQVVAQDPAYHLAEVAFPGGRLFVPNLKAPAGAVVRLRIRARDAGLSLHPPEDVSILNILPGQVLARGPADGGLVEVQVAIGPTTVIARITLKALDRLGLKPGCAVYVLVKSISFDSHGRD
ncbi:MAG: molybdenum ABC transporter ATP-binding protein [Rhodospirillaceae bacterium]